jgi:hypothetical protein
MASRKLNGFLVESTAIQTDPGSSLYRPGAIVRRENQAESTTYDLRHLSADEVSETEAHRLAEGYLATILAVTEDGLLWDRPPQ